MQNVSEKEYGNSTCDKVNDGIILKIDTKVNSGRFRYNICTVDEYFMSCFC